MAARAVMEQVREKGLFFDGAMGTMLIKAGLAAGTAAESWVLDRPLEILRLHQGYIEAGADVVTSATFGGHPLKLEKYGLGKHVEHINEQGALLAREAAGTHGFTAGNMGPTGELLHPSGSMTIEEAVQRFKAAIPGI